MLLLIGMHPQTPRHYESKSFFGTKGNWQFDTSSRRHQSSSLCVCFWLWDAHHKNGENYEECAKLIQLSFNFLLDRFYKFYIHFWTLEWMILSNWALFERLLLIYSTTIKVLLRVATCCKQFLQFTVSPNQTKHTGRSGFMYLNELYKSWKKLGKINNWPDSSVDDNKQRLGDKIIYR